MVVTQADRANAAPAGDSQAGSSTEPNSAHLPYVNQPFARGKVWKISKDGVAKATVFGTFHIGEPAELGWDQSMVSAVEKVARLVLEVVPGEKLSQEGEKHRSLPENTDLAQMLDERSTKLLRAAAVRAKSEPESLLRYRPWAALATLQAGKYLTTRSLDEVLHARALSAGVAVIGLETLDEQVKAADCSPLADQLHLLSESLKHAEAFDRVNERMIQLYRAGNMGALLDYAKDALPLPPSAQAVEDRDMVCLLEQRNHRIARRLDRLLAGGNALIAVGVFHLVGHDGVLCRLERAGYDIAPLVDERSSTSSCRRP